MKLLVFNILYLECLQTLYAYMVADLIPPKEIIKITREFGLIAQINEHQTTEFEMIFGSPDNVTLH